MAGDLPESPKLSVVNQPISNRKSIRGQIILILLISTVALGGALGTFYIMSVLQSEDKPADIQVGDSAEATGSYVEPDYPSCAAGSFRYTFAGELLNTAGRMTIVHKMNLDSPHSLIELKVLKKEGHPENGCSPGVNNDSGKSQCDQSQPNEGFTVTINNSLYATVPDGGPQFDDDWSSHNFDNQIELNAGVNDINLTHIGGVGVGSVDYKASLCYRPTVSEASASPVPSVTNSPKVSPSATAISSPAASPSATPINSPTVSPVGSAGVGGPEVTPQVSAIPTMRVTTYTSDGLSDGLGCAQNDCSGNRPNEVEANKAVADSGTSTLPEAGIPGGVYMLIAGVLFLASGVLIGKQKTKI